MPKVSVIIPVYNVEKYLKQCLESVINQSFKDIEIVCINDGSTDNSLEICNMYAHKDNRIRIIDKANEGASSARNLGLKVATGDFVYFLDADDYIEKDMIKIMVGLLDDNRCEIAICGYNTIPKYKKHTTNFKTYEVMSGKDLIRIDKKIHSNCDLCFSWRYMYRRDLISNLYFERNIRYGEDFIFNLQALCKAEKVIVTDKCMHYYRINNNSLMHKKYKKDFEINLETQYKKKKRISVDEGLLDYKDYRNNLAYYYLNSIMPNVFSNLYESDIKVTKSDIKRILNYSMFKDSFKILGFTYKSYNFKEYAFYLMMKFKCYSFIYYYLNKSH